MNTSYIVKDMGWKLSSLLLFLRPESISDLKTTSSENQSTIDLVEKDVSLACKGKQLTLIITSIIIVGSRG